VGKTVIVGAGGHAKVVLEILRLRPGCEVVGLLDPDEKKHGLRLLGLPVLGGDELLPGLRREQVEEAIVAVGDNRLRQRLFSVCRELGFELAQAIHPAATISPSARLGAGTAAMAGVVVNAEAVIGENVVLNTGCSVDHDCLVGDHAHIAPGAHLGGEARVGAGALVGLGASVLPAVEVGEWAVVGAGAVVTEEVPPRRCVAGVPAREQERR
jgi:UDP-perosamine 4-acetyltransferase